MAIGAEMKIDLGNWIKRRLRCGVEEQGRTADEQIEDCRIPLDELKAQWASQKELQLSIRARESPLCSPDSSGMVHTRVETRCPRVPEKRTGHTVGAPNRH